MGKNLQNSKKKSNKNMGEGILPSPVIVKNLVDIKEFYDYEKYGILDADKII